MTRALVEQARMLPRNLGPTAQPVRERLARRGLATLSLRFHRACENSLELAETVRGRGGVERVYYPGLPSHPDYELATRLLEGGFGAIVTIDLGTRERAQSFIRNLSEIPFAPSLGDVQTTLGHGTSTSHRGQSEEQAGAPRGSPPARF